MSSDSNASNDPLVSIICRTIGRPHLADALASIAKQSYANIEVVLVNASTNDISSLTQSQNSLSITELGGDKPLARADAANVGIEAANGAYLMFLDDDDWIGENHITTLVEALKNQTSDKAAYCCTQKAAQDGTLIDEVFRQPYDAALLLRDNFMPIHSVLFDRSLIEQGCRFDTSFDILEDWDFWLQLSQLTNFFFVDKITAFYRSGGESETGQEDISVRYDENHVLGKARADLFSKWLNKWSGKELNAMLASMDQADLIASLRKSIGERDEKLKSEHEINLSHQNQIKELLSEADSLNAEINSQKHSYSVQEDKLLAIQQHSDNQQALLDQITDSVSWKLTKPLRALGRMVRKNK